MDRHTRRWHDWAARAAFVPYEPVAPGRTNVWAGGFGGKPSAVRHLGIRARIDGTDVGVDTADASSMPPDGPLLEIVHRLVTGRIDGRQLRLPLTLEVVAADRTIVVDGTPTVFRGAKAVGAPTWLGYATLGELVISVELPTAVDGLELRRCRDISTVSEFPPHFPGRPA